MKISEPADQVRDIPLRDVLEHYGFEVRPEARRCAQRTRITTSSSQAAGGSITRQEWVAAVRLIWLSTLPR
jgi:hypothetical protein